MMLERVCDTRRLDSYTTGKVSRLLSKVTGGKVSRSVAKDTISVFFSQIAFQGRCFSSTHWR